MSRILAIDYGEKRTGLAVSDPLQIIASPLDTIETSRLNQFIRQYLAEQDVEKIIIGMPYRSDGTLPIWAEKIINFAKSIEKEFPQITIEFYDERYTSKMAKQALIQGGFSKKQRRKKENIDKIAAAIMLQEFLGNI